MVELRTAVIDFVQRQRQLIGVMVSAATVFAALVGKDGLAERQALLEGQDTVIGQVGGRD